jgi:hypothetical protein
MHEFLSTCGGGANANGIDFNWDFPGSNLFQSCHRFCTKKVTKKVGHPQKVVGKTPKCVFRRILPF